MTFAISLMTFVTCIMALTTCLRLILTRMIVNFITLDDNCMDILYIVVSSMIALTTIMNCEPMKFNHQASYKCPQRN